MGLVRAHSERVATSRRARPVRVLLVDETSIRRRHRYVTVVACGDTGKVLAMIDGRTKAALSRFFRDQGPGWCRKVEIVVSDGSRSYQAAIAQYLPRRPPRPRPLSTWPAGSPKDSPWYGGNCNAAPRISGPPRSSRTCSKPGFTLLRRADHLTDGHQKHLDRLFEAHPRAPDRVGSSPGALPALRSRRPRRRQPGPGTVRRPLRHRADPRVPRSRGHHHRLGRRDLGLPPQQTSNQRTHPKGSTTCSRSYAESLTGSPTQTISQPEEFS